MPNLSQAISPFRHKIDYALSETVCPSLAKVYTSTIKVREKGVHNEVTRMLIRQHLFLWSAA